MIIKPIRTKYAGIKFRSRREARWARFFDKTKVLWEYEPEGVVLDNGKCYLPDFKLYDVFFDGKRIDLYVEVKGEMDEDSAAKIVSFAESHPVIVLGGIPNGNTLEEIVTDCEKWNKEHPGFMDGFLIDDKDGFVIPYIRRKGGLAFTRKHKAILRNPFIADEKATLKAYREAHKDFEKH